MLADEQAAELDAAQLRRAKRAVTATFIAHAVVFASWVAHIPHVQDALHLSDGALGSALFGAPVGSVTATILSHWALQRWGSRRLVPVLLTGYAVAAVTVGFATTGYWLFAALALWGSFQGALDVAMNTQAAAVERLEGTPSMARFHGMWSVGGLVGALIGAACVTGGVNLTVQLIVLGVIVLVSVVPLTRHLVPDAEPAAHPEPSERTWVTGTVAILGAVAFASFVCEGAAADWSANYMRDVVGARPGVAALAFAAYSLTMVVTRLGAVALESRLSRRQLVSALAMLAVVGMTITLLTANPVLSVLGFAALGAGVALLVPTAFSAAYSASTAGSAISIVAATGWIGYVLSPPLVGHLAEFAGLQAALIVIPVMASFAGLAVYFTRAFDAAEEFDQQ